MNEKGTLSGEIRKVLCARIGASYLIIFNEFLVTNLHVSSVMFSIVYEAELLFCPDFKLLNICYFLYRSTFIYRPESGVR